MITGKIIVKAATKLSLNQRFGEIAKQTPTTVRLQQQTNVFAPRVGQALGGNQRSNALSIVNRLKQRSIQQRLSPGFARAHTGPALPRVFQRLSLNNRTSGRGKPYLLVGQNVRGIRPGGHGRVATRLSRLRRRSYMNSTSTRETRSRHSTVRFNRARRAGQPNVPRKRSATQIQKKAPTAEITKTSLDDDLETYMAQTNIDANDMNTL